MQKAWHIFKRLTVLVLAAVWLQTVAHTAVCHSDNALCGHDGCSESTVCCYHCHVALEQPAAGLELRAPERIVSVTPDYVTLPGTSVPADIFRPPLANS